MALQSSGQISLNDIHVEAGGASGTLASINDSDIRGLIGKGSGVAMSFSEWYGASAAVYSGSITTGNPTTIAYVGVFYGYWATYSMGSISPAGTINGGNIDGIYGTDGSQKNLYLDVVGNVPNSGWTTFTVGGTTVSRSAATYSYGAPGTAFQSNITRWFWTGFASNPIGTNSAGVVRSVLIT